MPDHGSLMLRDVKTPTLTIVCSPCSRLERYDVERLIAQHGNAKLTELLQMLADCQKARSASVYDKCKAVYEGLATR